MPPEKSIVIDFSDDDDVPAPVRQAPRPQQRSAPKSIGAIRQQDRRDVPRNGRDNPQRVREGLASNSRQFSASSKINDHSTAPRKLQPSSIFRSERPSDAASSQGSRGLAPKTTVRPEASESRRQGPVNLSQRENLIRDGSSQLRASNGPHSSRSGSQSTQLSTQSQRAITPNSAKQAPGTSHARSPFQGQKRAREDEGASTAPQTRPRIAFKTSQSVAQPSLTSMGRTEHSTALASKGAQYARRSGATDVIDLTKSPEPESPKTGKRPQLRQVPSGAGQRQSPQAESTVQTSTPQAVSNGKKSASVIAASEGLQNSTFQASLSAAPSGTDRTRVHPLSPKHPKAPTLSETVKILGQARRTEEKMGEDEQSRPLEIPESPPLLPSGVDRTPPPPSRKSMGPTSSSPHGKYIRRRQAAGHFGDTMPKTATINNDKTSSPPLPDTSNLTRYSVPTGTESDEDTTYGSLGSKASNALSSFEKSAPLTPQQKTTAYQVPISKAGTPTFRAGLEASSSSLVPIAARKDIRPTKGSAAQHAKAQSQEKSFGSSSSSFDEQSKVLHNADTIAAKGEEVSLGPSQMKDKEKAGIQTTDLDERVQRPNLNKDAASSKQDSGVFIPSASPALKSPMPAFAGAGIAKHIELAVGRYFEESRKDNEHWTRTELRRARHDTTKLSSGGSEKKPTSVFKSLKPIRLNVVTERNPPQSNTAKLCVEQFPCATSKPARTFYALECDMFKTRAADVPPYSHYVSIKNNFLAGNEKTLQHWPYFGDDFDLEEAKGLKIHYYPDIDSRERKLLRLGQAESFAAYAEDMLSQIGCDWSDVLWFLLDPSPDVGGLPDAQKAVQNRHKYCEEDFDRESSRWSAVLTRLPKAKADTLAKAALLCDQFQRITKFPLWQVARRSGYTRKLLEEAEESETDDQLTCRICMRFNCPYHGEIEESEDEGHADGKDVVATDIINPRDVDIRARVYLPAEIDNNEHAVTKIVDRQSLDYWSKGKWSSLKWQATERKPFYPCHHPGLPCESAKCSCFVEHIMCEKSCSCSRTCPRKFQGCSCSSEKTGRGQKLVCFDDDRCACFQRGRECDPDLCGACGVCSVLDPVYKYRELRGQCRNASIQRGVAKHTMIGDSGIHGLGLYTCEDIRPHDFLGEYKGEIINKAEADRRGAVYEHQKLSYLFSLNETQEIDSTYFGNKVRFINHADKSKCNIYPRIIMVNTVFRIALYGQKKVKPGEELFFDYGPMFPDEQLGGKTQKKAAPRVRNSNLVHDFYDVEQVEDKHGNVRARKVTSDASEDGRSSNDGIDATPRKGHRPAAKKSLNSKKRPRGYSAPGPSAKARRLEDIEEEGMGEDLEPQEATAADGEVNVFEDAEQRLYGYNILDGELPVDPADEEFEPENSASEASHDEDSSMSGDELRFSRRQRGRPRKDTW
ncbi:Histone-lysine N-methyltransferase E(z) [Pseudocercospora fuligena]|uniref:Histone-lysine N-methyltransferase E(Z) n=1 Tax=Pseudocercospora fuligena TaxID=685502 RepID=A0A8H6RIJ3_9PEZI|nr:Histone-lysine N-methyltransferase E(z) [Pseudocercospora fuligena]